MIYLIWLVLLFQAEAVNRREENYHLSDVADVALLIFVNE